MPVPSSDATDEDPDPDRGLIDKFFIRFQRSRDARDEYNLWKSDVNSLQSSSHVDSFFLGTGEEIWNRVCLAIEQAQSEVTIVTCFWAKSASQERLSASLLTLARSARAQNRLVDIYLCFSSLSLWQKFTHTASREGQLYPPETWPNTFGLPSEQDLLETCPLGPVGVRLRVKSIFIRPMSVMHPKFIIIDDKRAFLPSCNISWENWFEGCIELRGDILGQFLRFYQRTWESTETPVDFRSMYRQCSPLPSPEDHGAANDPTNGVDLDLKDVPTLFLPSPHHSNPRFRPSCLLTAPTPPVTPLNVFLSAAIANAQQHIYIQTPNFTSPVVFSELFQALSRGVNVKIVTSSRMMVLEQLITAGTITELFVRALIRRYKALLIRSESRRNDLRAIEEASTAPGKLSIRYFTPDLARGSEKEPVKSHLKLTIIDDRGVVLGSGNMDRASWYTSQELGVAFFSTTLARRVKETVEKGLEGRLSGEQVH